MIGPGAVIKLDVSEDRATEAALRSCKEREVFSFGGMSFSITQVSSGWAVAAEIKRIAVSQDLNKAIETSAWNGEGLPPVGAVCEFTHSGDGVRGRWIPCQVLAYGGVGDFGKTVAIQTADEIFSDRGGLSVQSNLDSISWRPIRTPEQIAAEERDLAIRGMLALAAITGESYRDVCGKLYDAGYRKSESK